MSERLDALKVLLAMIDEAPEEMRVVVLDAQIQETKRLIVGEVRRQWEDALRTKLSIMHDVGGCFEIVDGIVDDLERSLAD